MLGVRVRFVFFLSTFFFLSCSHVFVPVQNEYINYRIEPSVPRDSAMHMMLRPYRDSIESTMNEVVGHATATLEKKQPNGSLGHFMADAMLFGAREKFGLPVHVSFVNNGGIRIQQLPKGEVTRGKVFELMPFDNLVVVQELKGSELQQLLDITASRGGWPVAGLTMQIKDKRATNVMINGAPLDMAKTYIVANSDYVANGGDDANVLRNIPQKNMGYLLRDAIFDYIKYLKLQGQDIIPQEENRVSYAQ